VANEISRWQFDVASVRYLVLFERVGFLGCILGAASHVEKAFSGAKSCREMNGQYMDARLSGPKQREAGRR